MATTPRNIHADLISLPLPLAQSRRKLRFLRYFGWLVFLIEAWALAACLVSYSQQHGRWFTYGWTLALVLAWFHGLPLLLARLLAKVEARVGRHGDRWRIGKYSEAELRGDPRGNGRPADTCGGPKSRFATFVPRRHGHGSVSFALTPDRPNESF